MIECSSGFERNSIVVLSITVHTRLTANEQTLYSPTSTLLVCELHSLTTLFPCS